MNKVNLPEVVAEVTAAVEQYEQALSTNDVERLNEWFWKSPLAVRFGIGENLYGHDAIAAFRSARKPGNLRRLDTRAVITTFGRDWAAVSVAFEQGDPPRAGRMSQSWARMAEGWRIVAAHVSFLPAKDQK
jgi:hypothetical protein